MKPADLFTRMSFEFFKKVQPSDTWQATTQDVRELATPCPVCKNYNLAGHRYALLASQVAAEVTDELKHFFAFFRERRWQELSRIREFEGRWNAALIYAVICHRGGCMMAVRDPVELLDASNVLELIPFDEEEAEGIRSLPIELREL